MESIAEDIIKNPFTQTVIVIVSAVVVKKISAAIINRIVKKGVRFHDHASTLEERKREDTISTVFKTLTGVVIWIIALGVIASLFDINLAAVAASLGLFGVVIGLGAQTTIRDYVAGIYILLENQYRVGDIVTLSGGTTGALGTSGVVEEISLRITKLRDLDGTLNIVRNGEASIVTNRTFQYSSVVIDINVAFGTDIDLVEKVLNKTGIDMLEDEAMKKIISEPVKFLRVDKFTDSAIVVKAIGVVQPAEQWTVAGEYRRRILKAFAKENIIIPFPQVVVHGIDTKTIKK